MINNDFVILDLRPTMQHRLIGSYIGLINSKFQTINVLDGLRELAIFEVVC